MRLRSKLKAICGSGGVSRTLSLVLCLLTALLLFSPFSARAEDTEKKTVRVGWYESTYCYVDQFGRREGIAYEYQHKLSAYTGWEYEYVEDSWPNLLEKLKAGEIDLMSDVSYTEERSEQMLFPSLPMGAESYYIYVDEDNTEITPEDLTTLNGKRIGVNKGSVQEGFLRDWAEKNDLSLEILPLSSGEAYSLEQLSRGELDGIVTMDSFGAVDSCVPVCKVGASEYYFAVNKERPDLLAELNNAMNSIQDEDPYYNQRISEQYMSLTKTNAFLTPRLEEWLSEHGTIRVGYWDGYLPFCSRDKSTGELTGGLRDYLTFASNCMKNANLQFEAVPFASTQEALDALYENTVDCVFPVNLSSHDCESMGLLTVNPVMQTEMYALIRPDKESGLGKGESVTAAYSEAYSNYDNFVKNAFPNWKSVTYPTNDECFQAVSAGEANCVLVCNFRLFEMESMRERYHLTAVPTGESMGLSFAVRASDSELYSILNKTVNLSDIQMEDAVLSAYSYLNRRVSMVQFLQDNWALTLAIVSSVFLVLLLLLNQKLMAERKANRQQLLVEDALRRELQQKEQLQAAQTMAYTDSLTRVKSKHAFVEAEQRMNRRITEGTVSEFAVAMFDVNDLKKVNDTLGHEAGDQLLQDACKMICVCFKHSPVFRIGGDEFVSILENSDYAARDRLYSGFEAQMEENRRLGGIVISSGMALYRPGEDKSIHTVFKRADEKMYHRKRMLKKMTPEETVHPE